MTLPTRVLGGLKKMLAGVLTEGLVVGFGAVQSYLPMGCLLRHAPGPAISLAHPAMITLTIPPIPVGSCTPLGAFLPQIVSLLGIILVLWGFVDCTWGKLQSYSLNRY
jgi:hypothetical protein